jgi:hypothetical protein
MGTGCRHTERILLFGVTIRSARQCNRRADAHGKARTSAQTCETMSADSAARTPKA